MRMTTIASKLLKSFPGPGVFICRGLVSMLGPT